MQCIFCFHLWQSFRSCSFIPPLEFIQPLRRIKAIRPENLLKTRVALKISTDYLLTGEIINKDLSLLSDKLKSVSPEQLRTIEKVIDQFIDLCKQ